MLDGAIILENIWAAYWTVQNELSYDPVIPLLGVYPRQIKHKNLCKNFYNMFTPNSPVLQPTQIPINKWINDKAMAYPQYKILLTEWK